MATIDECGLHQSLKELVNYVDGRLIFVAGPQGHGKTTTLRALVQEAITSPYRELKVVQLVSNEDNETMNVPTYLKPHPSYRKPLNNIPKIYHARRNSVVTTAGILAMNPDIVVIDDLNDPEMAHIAGTLAQGGMLVFVSIHSTDKDVIDRFHNILKPFNEVRQALEFPNVNYISVYQTLVKDASGKATPKTLVEHGIS